MWTSITQCMCRYCSLLTGCYTYIVCNLLWRNGDCKFKVARKGYLSVLYYIVKIKSSIRNLNITNIIVIKHVYLFYYVKTVVSVWVLVLVLPSPVITYNFNFVGFLLGTTDRSSCYGNRSLSTRRLFGWRDVGDLPHRFLAFRHGHT